MRGGAIQQNGGTHRVDPGTRNLTITTTAPLYASAAGRNWSITATLYETDINGSSIRTVDTHANYKLAIEKPYVPPTWESSGGDPYEDVSSDIYGDQNGNGNGNGGDTRWESSGGDPYEDVSSDIYGDQPAPAPTPQPKPLPQPTYWGGYDPYMDLPAYVSPVIPDWIRAQEEADDGMY
jgi:hypothetical protein